MAFALLFSSLLAACCFGVSVTAQVIDGSLVVRRDPAKPFEEASLETKNLQVKLKAGCSGQVELRRIILEFDRSTKDDLSGSLIFVRGERLLWLEISNLRLPQDFERCSSPNEDVGKASCYLGGGGVEKSLALEIAPKQLGYRGPSNKDWEIPCQQAEDARQNNEPGPTLLLFVGLREDVSTTYSLRPLKFSLSCCAPNPAGPEPWICPPSP